MLGLLVAACGRGGEQGPLPTPTSAPAPPAPLGVAAPEADMADYLARAFPPGPGRDIVFGSCSSCHTIAPILLAGPMKDQGAWEYTMRNHTVMYARAMSKEDIALVFKYLMEHFGPGKPAPTPIPEIFRSTWPAY